MLVFALAASISLLVTPVVRALAHRRGWVAHSAAKSGKSPAMLGGLVVLAAVVSSLLFAGRFDTFIALAPFWIGLLLISSMGMADDFKPLTPAAKLSTQIVVILLFLMLLIRFGQASWSLWTPLWFFWLLGITNAFNLLDNMDGLTAGVGAIAALGLTMVLFGDSAFKTGNGATAIKSARAGTSILSTVEMSVPSAVLIALAGGLAGFLFYNFSPARIYLGDSGSHLVGFTLAAIPLYRLDSSTGPEWHDLVILPLLLLVPICDTSYVTLSRLRRGVPISQGGKDHVSHRLLRAGFSEARVALIFYAAAILLVAFAHWVHRLWFVAR